ncbi:ANGPT2 [Branchiostoma lanceolatum]|uniref:ANGPT2 protein n=1 Tax=Branchiostoma lanceolatum TaxID=7740 RepID=A0A8J9YW30_BRALA|nr:ANGPT2 [Branchiostoma lanceolatum]
MQKVNENTVRAQPRLNNTACDPEPADCIGPRAEMPIESDQEEGSQPRMAGKEAPIAQLYGATTDHKESARPSGQAEGQDVGHESFKSRIYEDTTDIKDSSSSAKGEDEETPRPMSGLYGHGDPTDPDDSCRQSKVKYSANEGESSCCRRMFLTTFSRLVCVFIVAAVVMCVMAVTVVAMKTMSSSKSQVPTKSRPVSPWPTPFVTSASVDESSFSATLPAEPMTTTTPVLPGSDGTETHGILQTEGNSACAPGNCGDCAEIYEGGSTTSGVNWIKLQNNVSVEVYCDMDTDGGGWTVIQRRFDGSVPFNRTWADYKRGFGNKAGEHWLGNDNLHLLTNQRDYRLQIGFVDRGGKQHSFTCSCGLFR